MTPLPVLKINTSRQEVFVRGRRVFLTAKEFRILALLRERNRTLSREDILSEVWGSDRKSVTDLRAVDQHVCRLRRKIKAPLIETVLSYGYKYVGV